MPKPEEPLTYQDLYFAEEPEGQLEKAFALLSGLDRMQAEKTEEPNRLRISYSLRDYSLEGLEGALKQAGFCFKESLLNKISRRLVYYCEDVQYHNLSTPEHLTKAQTHVVFAKVYENHPHGDHDDTPEDLREYK